MESMPSGCKGGGIVIFCKPLYYDFVDGRHPLNWCISDHSLRKQESRGKKSLILGLNSEIVRYVDRK